MTVAEVLLVEDDEYLRDTLRDNLEARGFGVATAANGREALNYLRTHKPPRVILLDLLMPVMNGWEFRRQQKRDPDLAGIPVVVCSGVEDVRAEAELIGAAGMLQKPITSNELVNAVRRFCAAPVPVLTAAATACPVPHARSVEPVPR